MIQPQLQDAITNELIKQKKTGQVCYQTALAKVMTTYVKAEGHRPKKFKVVSKNCTPTPPNLNRTKLHNYFKKHDGPVSQVKLSEIFGISTKSVKRASIELVEQKHLYVKSIRGKTYYAAYPEAFKDVRG